MSERRSRFLLWMSPLKPKVERMRAGAATSSGEGPDIDGSSRSFLEATALAMCADSAPANLTASDLIDTGFAASDDPGFAHAVNAGNVPARANLEDDAVVLPETAGSKRKTAESDGTQPAANNPLDPNANSKGCEWTNEEDAEVMQQLSEIRHGQLSLKNMTVREAEKIQAVLKHRTVNAIKFRWNDKLKKRHGLGSAVDDTCAYPPRADETAAVSSDAQQQESAPEQAWRETSVDPDAFFTAMAPSQHGEQPAMSPPLVPTSARSTDTSPTRSARRRGGTCADLSLEQPAAQPCGIGVVRGAVSGGTVKEDADGWRGSLS